VKNVGLVTVIVVVAVAVVAAVVGVQSIPDAKRYLQMRKM
jgi:hypothetical protein